MQASHEEDGTVIEITFATGDASMTGGLPC